MLAGSEFLSALRLALRGSHRSREARAGAPGPRARRISLFAPDTRHLSLSAGRRASKPYRATIGRPWAGLEYGSAEEIVPPGIFAAMKMPR
jgi:hypothetical protein